jgi:flagellar basal-body rod modification protein FlgD
MDTSTITSSSQIQTDYMKLLITQLQNQNPLEPMDNDQMASQLAQFSQLQQMESLSTSFAQVLDTTQRSYAASLIGKEVTFMAESTSGEKESIAGVIEQILPDAGGEVMLSSGQHIFGLNDILSVRE